MNHNETSVSPTRFPSRVHILCFDFFTSPDLSHMVLPIRQVVCSIVRSGLILPAFFHFFTFLLATSLKTDMSKV